MFLPASDEADLAEEIDDGADEFVPEQIITDIEERSIVPKKMAEQVGEVYRSAHTVKYTSLLSH